MALASLGIYTVKTVLDYSQRGCLKGSRLPCLEQSQQEPCEVINKKVAQYIVPAERESPAQPPLEVCPSNSSTKRGGGRSQGTWAHPVRPTLNTQGGGEGLPGRHLPTSTSLLTAAPHPAGIITDTWLVRPGGHPGFGIQRVGEFQTAQAVKASLGVRPGACPLVGGPGASEGHC